MGAMALAGVAASLFWGATYGWSSFFRSYILNYCFVISIPLGALFFVLVQHLTGAIWSVAVRRIAEFVMGTLPWLALLGLPILIPVWSGDAEVYPWADSNEVSHDGLLQHKQVYLNPTFFTIRLLLYFGVWIFLSQMYRGYSQQQDLQQNQGANAELSNKLRSRSPIGVLLFALTTTFFAFDLLMSLTPHWYSTIFGVYFFAGSITSFFATMAILLWWLKRNGKLKGAVSAEHLHDIGKYLMGFSVFWAYISFSQYMLIWYADLPEETAWYWARQQSSFWLGVAAVLLLIHFAIPFLALLPRAAKRNQNWLAGVSGLVLVAHWLDMFYVVGPRYHHLYGSTEHANLSSWTAPVSDIGMAFAMTSLLLILILRQMEQSLLIPVNDPKLAESIVFENV